MGLTMALLSSAPLVVCVARPRPVDASLTFNKLVALATTPPLRPFNPPSVLMPNPQGRGLGTEPDGAQEAPGRLGSQQRAWPFAWPLGKV